MNLKMRRIGRIFALGATLTFATMTRSGEAFIASLNVTPTNPTPQSNIRMTIDLTNDTLNFCDYEVRLVAAYGGLTHFERTQNGNVIEFRGKLMPHLVAPTQVVQCDVPCIAIAKAPEAVYREIELGRLAAGTYTVRVTLPDLCGMETPCAHQKRVECEFQHPMTMTLRVGGTLPVESRGKLATTWARLRTL